MADIVKKVFCIGLPRCGGQTLQAALAYLVGPCVHSPGNDWESLDKYNAFTEVYIHPATLAQRYGKDNCVFLLNDRHVNGWLDSCRSVYAKSGRWNHPIWRYPIEGFEQYRRDYIKERTQFVDGHRTVDIIKHPRWTELCYALDVPMPDVAFPRIDRQKPPTGAVGPSQGVGARSLP